MPSDLLPVPEDDLDRFIGVPEAAARLDVHPVTARRWITQGTFPVPVLTVNGERRISLRRLVEFIHGDPAGRAEAAS